MRPFKKPKKLQPGDTIATVSLSWGGPGTFPYRYEIGKRQLTDAFDLHVVEMPNTLKDAAWIRDNPQARADDLMQAFSDPSIKGIISTIGGEDSIRILPYLDLDIIRENPKIFMGFSDTTISHFACFKAGLVSFYGPAIMAGFAENTGVFPFMQASFQRTVFESKAIGKIEPNNQGWTTQVLDWANPENQKKKRVLQPCTGWKFLQGKGTRSGHLLGGCIEVLDWLRGTPYWPEPEDWKGAILFIETSEEAPSPVLVERILRAMAAAGAMNDLHGILLGRPGGEIAVEQFEKYDQAVLNIVNDELGLQYLPIISNMDFGHSSPMFILPYGIQAEINCADKSFSLLESAVV